MNKWLMTIAIVVMFAGGLYGVYKAGYTNGKADEQIAVLEANQEVLKGLVSKVETVDANLYKQYEVQADIYAKLVEKQSGIKKEVVDYATNPSNNMVCLDAEWVRVYNKSLPNQGTKNSTTRRTNDSSGKASRDAGQPKQ